VPPLTLGTAGHVDHGKTTLVEKLTGVWADRLPEERERGLTIALGFAPLRLPSGRVVSVVDVPGHERFVRTMVAGASGIDAFLMVVAADDGVMPQTVEHAAVLRALGVRAGVVAITKTDLCAPARAAREAAALLPGCEVVAGVEPLPDALDRLAAGLPGRAVSAGPARLHVDRAFVVRGRGTVVTGTLWSGTIAVGDVVSVTPGALRARVRGVQVHDRVVDVAAAGQRVALNLVGVRVGADVARGSVVAAPGVVHEARVLDCALSLRDDARHGARVQVHHGTRDVPGRVARLSDDGLWQLRLESPVAALDGDRVVIRRLAPPDTLGGGVILDASAGRHGPRPEIVERLRALRAGEPPPPVSPPRDAAAARAASPNAAPSPSTARAASPHATTASPPDTAPSPPTARAASPAATSSPPATAPSPPTSRPTAPPSPPASSSPAAAPSPPGAAALEARLREAGTGLLSEAQIGDRATLAALRERGAAVRVSGRLYAHADVLAETRARIVALLERGPATLAGVRDALGLSRKTAQAFLEHLDAERVTRRLDDDRRVLSGRATRRAHDAPVRATPPPTHDAPVRATPPRAHDAPVGAIPPPAHDAPVRATPPPAGARATPPPAGRSAPASPPLAGRP